MRTTFKRMLALIVVSVALLSVTSQSYAGLHLTFKQYHGDKVWLSVQGEGQNGNWYGNVAKFYNFGDFTTQQYSWFHLDNHDFGTVKNRYYSRRAGQYVWVEQDFNIWNVLIDNDSSWWTGYSDDAGLHTSYISRYAYLDGISGEALVKGLSFSDLIPGTYKNGYHSKLGKIWIDVVPVPEPSTLALAGLGLGLLGFTARRRRDAQA